MIATGRMASVADFEILKAQALLGEGVLWDWRREELWWTDIQGRALYRHGWSAASTRVLPTVERLGSFGLVAGSARLIAAFESGIAMYDPDGASLEWLARPEEVRPGLRFNDGRVDRAGRFWCGTMVEDRSAGATGCLYSFDARAGLRQHVRGIRISNGLCTSPDGTRLYFADSAARTIWVHELTEPGGTLGEARVFAKTPRGVSPDGAAVDVDGCVWSAQWGAGAVVRYTPEGELDRRIEIPATQPSCVCFAGPDLDVLCVTTARVDLDEATLRAEPHAGDVFLLRTGVQGLPEPEYRP